MAHADCYMPRLQGASGGYCNGCRYEGAIALNHDETCERQPGQPNHGSVVEFLGGRIVQKAKHGIAGVNGATIAYQPSKGFVGTDDFVMEMSYRQFGQSGKYTTHYVVTVK